MVIFTSFIRLELETEMNHDKEKWLTEKAPESIWIVDGAVVKQVLPNVNFVD